MTSPFRVVRWWISDNLSAAGSLAAGVLSRTDPDAYQSGDRRPVLVIPGVYETWHFMQPVIDALHERGHPVYVLPALGHNRGSVAKGGLHVADFVRSHDLSDVFIAAHSKGGLIGKYAMVKFDPERRLARMAAIATPFSGSRYAHLAPNRTLRAFRSDDPVTRMLQEELEVNERIVSIFGEFDPVIPESSALEGAENVVVALGGHFSIIGHPETLARVVAAAEGP